MRVSKRQLRRIIYETVRLHEANVPDNIQKIVMDAVEGFEEGFEVTEFHVHPSTGAWMIETDTEDPDDVVPDFVDYLSQNETLSKHEINHDDWLIAIEPLDDAGAESSPRSMHPRSPADSDFAQVQNGIVDAAKQFNFKHAPIFEQDGEFLSRYPAWRKYRSLTATSGEI